MGIRTCIHTRSNFIFKSLLVSKVNVEVVKQIDFVALYKSIFEDLRDVLALYLHVCLKQSTDLSLVSATSILIHTQNSLIPTNFANDHSTFLASAH